MPDLFVERRSDHLPQRMFDLVSDLESYPRFIPNCEAMEVRDDATGGILARMTMRPSVRSAGLYQPRGRRSRRPLTITANATDGPFAFLDSKWTFTPEGEGTRIRFDIDFKIANPLIAAVAEPAFAAKQGEIIDAFEDEADRRFG